MNKQQWKNLARYTYDVSKLMVAVPVLGNLIAPRFSDFAFWIGIATAAMFLLFGYLLDRQPGT